MAKVRRCGRWVVMPVLSVLVAGCGLRDPVKEAARREHLTALRGQETTMPLEQQLAHASRAVELDPEGVAYLETRAGYYISLGRLDAAQADFDRAIMLHDRPYLRYSRGRVLCEIGALSPALADFDQAIAAQPLNTQFYGGRAIARLRAGRAAEALEDAARMIEQAPQDADGYYTRGVVLAALGRTQQAVEDLTRVVRERPELRHALVERARVYDQIGDPSRAEADRAEAAKRQPWGSTVCLAPRQAPQTTPLKIQE